MDREAVGDGDGSGDATNGFDLIILFCPIGYTDFESLELRLWDEVEEAGAKSWDSEFREFDDLEFLVCGDFKSIEKGESFCPALSYESMMSSNGVSLLEEIQGRFTKTGQTGTYMHQYDDPF
jgi:hypothetical protein